MKRFYTAIFLIFLFNQIAFSQLQSTWNKTLYYDDYQRGYPSYYDSLNVGPIGFVMRPDGNFFVLNNDDEGRDQSIYLLDSLGSITSTSLIGYWETLQEW